MYETGQPVYNNEDTHEMNESELVNTQEEEIDGMSEESETGSHANASESEDVNEEEIDEAESNDINDNDNSFQNTNQQTRRPIHQQLRELSSSNNNTNERPNAIKKYKLSYILSVLILIPAFFYLQYSSLFQKVFDTSNNCSEEGINITYTIGSHLNDLGKNLKGEVDKLNVTIEFCKDGEADKVEAKLISLNPRIPLYLHNFGKEIMIASKNLHDIYSKRKEVYKTFETEIEAMTNRLNSNDKGDAKYFKERLNNLIVIIENFIKDSMDETQSSIQKVGSIRNDTESQINKGREEFENLTANGYHHCLPNDDGKVTKEKENEAISNILGHLSDTADHLIKVENFLKGYKYKLTGVSSELEDTGKGDNGMFEVTKITDFEHLKLALSTI